jgi:hypothetical protein
VQIQQIQVLHEGGITKVHHAAMILSPSDTKTLSHHLKPQTRNSVEKSKGNNVQSYK